MEEIEPMEIDTNEDTSSTSSTAPTVATVATAPTIATVATAPTTAIVQHDNIVLSNILKNYPEIANFLIMTYTSTSQKRIKRPPSFGLLCKQFEIVLYKSIQKKWNMLFNCPFCKRFLSSPVTIECGHTYCQSCLNCIRFCFICKADINGPRSINFLIQDIVETWRERNKICPHKLKYMDSSDLLGMQPRYELRSRCVGLRFDNSADDSATTSNTNQDVSTVNFNISLNKFFKDILDHGDKIVDSLWELIKSDINFDCALCGHCFLEPITTSCGHTFCNGCLLRVMDYKLNCPICKFTLTYNEYCRKINVTLNETIKSLLPQQHLKSISINLQNIHLVERHFELPVFVCTYAFPTIACPLYVCEPRYRLLVRRCISGTKKRFAMAAKIPTEEKFVSYGTVLEIKDVVSLPFGNFIVTTVGGRRFKVLSRGEEDGYDTAKVQYIRDMAVTPEALISLKLLHDFVYNKASTWIMSLTFEVLWDVVCSIGPMPKVETNWYTLPDGPAWTWWVLPLLPLNPQLQLGFISTNDLRKRLKVINKMVDHMKVRMECFNNNPFHSSNNEGIHYNCGNMWFPYH